MALIKLFGVTVVGIKYCSFPAVLIQNFKVDWEAAGVKAHKDTLHTLQADLLPSACTAQEPRHWPLWLPVSCQEP